MNCGRRRFLRTLAALPAALFGGKKLVAGVDLASGSGVTVQGCRVQGLIVTRLSHRDGPLLPRGTPAGFSPDPKQLRAYFDAVQSMQAEAILCAVQPPFVGAYRPVHLGERKS